MDHKYLIGPVADALVVIGAFFINFTALVYVAFNGIPPGYEIEVFCYVGSMLLIIAAIFFRS